LHDIPHIAHVDDIVAAIVTWDRSATRKPPCHAAKFCKGIKEASSEVAQAVEEAVAPGREKQEVKEA